MFLLCLHVTVETLLLVLPLLLLPAAAPHFASIITSSKPDTGGLPCS
jgi:hypothetical protein